MDCGACLLTTGDGADDEEEEEEDEDEDALGDIAICMYRCIQGSMRIQNDVMLLSYDNYLVLVVVTSLSFVQMNVQ